MTTPAFAALHDSYTTAFETFKALVFVIGVAESPQARESAIDTCFSCLVSYLSLLRPFFSNSPFSG